MPPPLTLRKIQLLRFLSICASQSAIKSICIAMLRRHCGDEHIYYKTEARFFSWWPVNILDLFPIMARCTDYLIVYVIHYMHSGIEGMSPNASGFRPYLLHPLFSQRPYVVTMMSLTKKSFRVIPSIQIPHSPECV